MRGLAVGAAVLFSVSCHLADDRDPPKCESGTHPENGRCVPDALSGPTVTIASADGGTSCASDPDTINVKVNGEFRFKNDDAVEHEIRGADNQVWLAVKPGQLSGYFAITKPGSWAYSVSGCAKGGTVVVE
jgi:hypothetical protein